MVSLALAALSGRSSSTPDCRISITSPLLAARQASAIDEYSLADLWDRLTMSKPLRSTGAAVESAAPALALVGPPEFASPPEREVPPGGSADAHGAWTLDGSSPGRLLAVSKPWRC